MPRSFTILPSFCLCYRICDVLSALVIVQLSCSIWCPSWIHTNYVHWGKVVVTWMTKYLGSNIWSTIQEMSDSRKHILGVPLLKFSSTRDLSTAVFSVMSMCTYLAVYLVEEAGISDKILHNSPSHAHFRCIPFMLWHSMRVLKSKCHVYILLHGVISRIPVL